jgi:hypothetical protein
MTVLSRKIASIPVRSASATWLRIVDLVAPTNAEARTELLAVTGVAASLVAREAMTTSPVIVAGKGPQLRLYCVHGEEAVEGTHVNEAALPASPAESEGWTVSLPCPKGDLSWVQESLKPISERITARDEEDRFLPDLEEEASEGSASINTESFLRP